MVQAEGARSPSLLFSSSPKPSSSMDSSIAALRRLSLPTLAQTPAHQAEWLSASASMAGPLSCLHPKLSPQESPSALCSTLASLRSLSLRPSPVSPALQLNAPASVGLSYLSPASSARLPQAPVLRAILASPSGQTCAAAAEAVSTFFPEPQSALALDAHSPAAPPSAPVLEPVASLSVSRAVSGRPAAEQAKAYSPLSKWAGFHTPTRPSLVTTPLVQPDTMTQSPYLALASLLLSHFKADEFEHRLSLERPDMTQPPSLQRLALHSDPFANESVQTAGSARLLAGGTSSALPCSFRPAGNSPSPAHCALSSSPVAGLTPRIPVRQTVKQQASTCFEST